MPHQIQFIRKPDRENTHEAIERVMGIQENGVAFDISREECATYIRQGHKFVVRVGLYEVSVEAYQRFSTGPWFIRTQPDMTRKDNLLSLPEY